MKLVKQGGRLDYNYKEFYFNSKKGDSLSDIADYECYEGSIAFDMGTSTVYMLDKEKEWIPIVAGGSGSGSGSGGGSIDINGSISVGGCGCCKIPISKLQEVIKDYLENNPDSVLNADKVKEILEEAVNDGLLDDYIKRDELGDWAKEPNKPEYTPEEIGTLSAEQIQEALDKKVDAEEDKDLMTKEEREKLASLENYDDSEIKEAIDDIRKIGDNNYWEEHQDYIPKEGELVIIPGDGTNPPSIKIGDGKTPVINLASITTPKFGLEHTLTIGDKVFDDTEDVVINVYEGIYDDIYGDLYNALK